MSCALFDNYNLLAAIAPPLLLCDIFQLEKWDIPAKKI